MANISLTSTSNTIKADFGDYNTTLGYSKGMWAKSDIYSVKLFSDHVEIDTQEQEHWQVADTSVDGYQVVDTVAGVAPTSLSDLYDKITALLA